MTKPANRWFSRDGEFSKTASFASMANGLALALYVFQSLFTGLQLTTSLFSWTVPAFDVTAAVGIMAILNGTYLGNNALKNKAAPPVAEADATKE